jgi:hypothetical protein
MMENVVQTGHIIIAVCTLLGFLASAIGIFFGIKVTISKAIYDIAALTAEVHSMGMKLDNGQALMQQILLAQNTLAIKLEAVEKRVELGEKHLDTIDDRLQAAQRAISDTRLENRYTHGRPPAPAFGSVVTGK